MGDFMDLLRMPGTTSAEELHLRHEINNTRAEKNELFEELERLHGDYEIASSVEADKIYQKITVRQNVYVAMGEYLAECTEKLDAIRYAKHIEEEK